MTAPKKPRKKRTVTDKKVPWRWHWSEMEGHGWLSRWLPGRDGRQSLQIGRYYNDKVACAKACRQKNAAMKAEKRKL